MKVALITGITGQDGSYLADLLLDKGYEVHGIVRRASTFNTGRIDHILDRISLHYGDVCDAGSVMSLVHKIAPDEIYHLAAQSHVRVSFDVPAYTTESVALSTTHMLEALRQIVPHAHYYQASSSEMFGSSPPPQNERTPFAPRSPYACAKVYAYHMAQNYRDGYGLHISNGILFNHESPRRGETFVSRKIARAAVRMWQGEQDRLSLGNLEARRDWGWAPEYVEAMWRMMQQGEPGDYVIATGESHTVREMLEVAFAHLGPHMERTWSGRVDADPRLIRPTELDHLRGDASLAAACLGWVPQVRFRELVERMVQAEVKASLKEPAK